MSEKLLLKPASQTPKLTALAFGCMSGACNPSGIIRSLAEAIEEIDRCQIKDHPAIKMVLGQLSYLAGESCGPSTEAVAEYDAWRVWSEVCDKCQLTFEQYQALQTVKSRWSQVGDPHHMIGGNGCVIVNVIGEGSAMTLGIEPDGYTHS